MRENLALDDAPPTYGRSGSQVSAPWTTMHADEGPQQSPSEVHAWPSATQLDAHENPLKSARHRPEQHSEGIAQLVAAE